MKKLCLAVVLFAFLGCAATSSQTAESQKPEKENPKHNTAQSSPDVPAIWEFIQGIIDGAALMH